MQNLLIHENTLSFLSIQIQQPVILHIHSRPNMNKRFHNRRRLIKLSEICEGKQRKASDTNHTQTTRVIFQVVVGNKFIRAHSALVRAYDSKFDF